MDQDYIQISDDTIQKITDEHNRIISMFIHELRNPLSLIKGTLQYIEMKYTEVSEYKYWDQLSDLILDMEHMLSEASLLNSVTNLNIKNSNLLSLIHTVVDNYMPQAENQQKLLSFKASSQCESLLTSYPCDSDKIKQAISNLIKNALEATSPGNFIDINLSIDSKDTDSLLSIQINNNGLPIPEDDIDSIFLPFVSHKTGGTGVGLALVKRIVEAHKGSIHVSSTDELTGFTILLPLL
ncbi:MAG: HAMP domain-containing histidine kinase [Anaerolineaceae bacterium]|nr:MAG: HAMP domain-containing histidine kinase [Anaerolineaceae bacterium]